jgi:hypothetical protein
MQELKSMIPRTSQYHPGHEIPEKNWYYRIAKRFLFNDFGVYNGRDHSKTAAPYITQAEPKLSVTGNASAQSCSAEPRGCSSAGQVVKLGVTPTERKS